MSHAGEPLLRQWGVGIEDWGWRGQGGGAATSCSLQTTLRRVSGGGVNWRLEWSRVVGGGSWDGMRLHLQVHLPRRGEDGRGEGGHVLIRRWWWWWDEPGHWVGMTRRGPLHPGATRKMLRNFGKGVTGWLREGGRRLRARCIASATDISAMARELHLVAVVG